ANVANYRVPERSLGNNLKQVFYLDVSGNRIEIPQLDVNDLPYHDVNSSQPAGYILYDEEVKILPTPTVTAGSLEMWYYRRPNQIVPTTSCAKITGVTSVGGLTTLTVDTDLSAALTASDLVDIISGKSPFMS